MTDDKVRELRLFSSGLGAGTFYDEKGRFVSILNVDDTEYQLLLEKAKDGVLNKVPTSDKNTVVRRCEFLHEMWVVMGSPSVKLGNDKSRELEDLAPRYSYYRKAVQWHLTLDGFSGLYDARDIQDGITWAEIAYLAYFVYGKQGVLDWNAESRGARNTCVLFVTTDGVKRLETSLAQYKNQQFFSNYLVDLQEGIRYIPVILHLAIKELCVALGGLIEYDEAFNEVTVEEAQRVIEKLK